MSSPIPMPIEIESVPCDVSGVVGVEVEKKVEEIGENVANVLPVEKMVDVVEKIEDIAEKASSVADAVEEKAAAVDAMVESAAGVALEMGVPKDVVEKVAHEVEVVADAVAAAAEKAEEVAALVVNVKRNCCLPFLRRFQKKE